VARAIVKWRESHGAFADRKQLLDVTGLGPKTFEQSAGFLRIRSGDNPLDMTGVHPETYPVVQAILARTGRPVAEIMGRHAGWLAGAACLAGGDDCEGPDLILLPEVPFDPDRFLTRVDELQRVKPNVIIAASEGVKTADGTYLCDLVSTAGQLDAFGHKAILSGTSRYLSDLIHDNLNCKSRAIEFSTLQRCASHLASRTDVNEAYAVGGAAASAAFAGETGRMISLKRISDYPYQCITESVDVQQVANLEKKVPLDWITPDGMQVTAAFEEYARPLILDEVTPVYVNGTPRHICL
jgi:6-phosphofructokinase 1